MVHNGMQRKLRAIFSADVKGYSMLMGDDDEHTINTITAYREIITGLIEVHHGRVVDASGDNILAEFSGALNAVNSAIQIQKKLETENSKLPDNRRMDFRIGINLGDIVHRDDRIYGDGVNVAARIESLADPGGICISRGVFDQVKSKVRQGFEYLGEHTVKNIPEPVRIYRVLLAPEFVGKVIGEPVARPTKLNKPYTATIAAILILSAVLLWFLYPRTPDIEPASVEKMAFQLPEVPSIAVLPFDNLSGDPGEEYFSDGITEQIITSLSKIPLIFVVARNSTFAYKGKAVQIQQIAEDLGVRYVLEGSIQRSDEQVRVNAQLIDAISGHHLWAERYDRKISDIFILQDEITLKILAALQVKLSVAELGQLSSIKTDYLEAYENLLEGYECLWKRNVRDVLKARELAHKAIELDPNYGAAYQLLARTHLNDVWFYRSKDRAASLKTATELAQKSISLTGDEGSAHMIMSQAYLLGKDYENAIAEGQRSIELNPNSSEAHNYYGLVLRYSERYNEAIPIIERAIRLNPVMPDNYYSNLAFAYNGIGQYQKAISIWNQVVERNPDFLHAFVGLTVAYHYSGEMDKARESAVNIMRIKPDYYLSVIKKRSTMRDGKEKSRVLVALEKAGIPEYPPNAKPEKPAIAVLPFVNMSGDPNQQFFSDGITEQIITSISKVPYISVIARQSSFAFRDRKETVQQIAKTLGVKYILEGSLQRSGDQLRINAQLIDAPSGNHVWAKHYDRELKDIFDVQDEICKSIMVALQVNLTLGEIARIDVATVDINAYQKYLKALEHYRRRIKDDVFIARQLAHEAIAIDPEYASAYLLIGWTYLDEVWFGITINLSNSIAQAEEMVQKTISIRGVTAAENGLLSSIHLLKKDLEKAIFYAQEAINEHPSGAAYHHILGMALRSNGQYHEAIACFKRALQLNPIKSINYMNNLASAYLYSKQYEKAISTWNETIARNPDYLFAYMGLTCAYWLTGSKNQAKEAAKHVLRINPKFSVGYWEKRSYLKDKELREQIFDAWRKAGLK